MHVTSAAFYIRELIVLANVAKIKRSRIKDGLQYIKDLNAWRILMNFLCIYLSEGRWGGGGRTNACICMGTHSQPLLQNRLMDVYKT